MTECCWAGICSSLRKKERPPCKCFDILMVPYFLEQRSRLETAQRRHRISAPTRRWRHQREREDDMEAADSSLMRRRRKKETPSDSPRALAPRAATPVDEAPTSPESGSCAASASEHCVQAGLGAARVGRAQARRGGGTPTAAAAAAARRDPHCARRRLFGWVRTSPGDCDGGAASSGCSRGAFSRESRRALRFRGWPRGALRSAPSPRFRKRGIKSRSGLPTDAQRSMAATPQAR